jgi:hypothetical protein
MAKTYHASCICRSVQIEATIDLKESGTGKCNCTICGKLRYFGVKITPLTNFRIVHPKVENFQPATPIEVDGISNFNLTTPTIHHPFCSKCGTHVFGHGSIPQAGGDFVSVSLACIDDLDPAEMEGIQVRYADGKNNNWWNQPSEAEKKLL